MNKEINDVKHKVSPLHILPGNNYRLLYFLLTCSFVLGTSSCKNSHTSSEQAQQAVQKTDSVNGAHDTLAAQFNAARMQIDNLSSQKALLDTQIMAKNAEIVKLKKEIGHLGRKNKELAAKLKKDEKFIKSIKDELSEKARAFAESIGLLQSENTYLKRERDSFMTKYAALKELGSVLHVSNFRLESLHLKHHGKKEKETARAKRVNDLRVYFDIDENHISDNGLKDLYLVIIGPGGKLLTSANNSGNITTNKGTIGYSILKEISLKKDEPVRDIKVDWKQDSDYERGVYNISIYNSGFRIGGGSATLR